MKKNTFVSKSLFVVFISLSVQTNTQKISVHLKPGNSCPLEKKGGVETREKNRPQKNFGEKKISKKALDPAQYDDDFDARIMTVTPPTGRGGRQKSHPKRRSTGGTPSRRRAKVHEQRKAQRDDDDDDLLERIARKENYYENKGTPLLPT